MLKYLPECGIIIKVRCARMTVEYDKKKIDRIIEDFWIMNGICISVLNTDFKPIAENRHLDDFCMNIQKDKKYKQRCVCSDNMVLSRCIKSHCFEEHICHMGLWDAATPITVDDRIVGYVIMGRIKTDSSPDRSPIRDKELERMYRSIPYFSRERIESFKELLHYVLLEQSVRVTEDDLFSEITAYISDNLKGDLSVPALSKRFGISKNKLYQLCRKEHDTTVNHYITDLRLAKAKELIQNTDEALCRISEAVGFENYTYFSKVFREKTGLSPSAYTSASRIG